MLPSWCDGSDAQARSILLVGGHQVRQTQDGPEVLAEVLRCLAQGSVPDGVHVVTYAPAASAAIAEILGGTHDEHLLDGPRGSGKTQAVPGAVAGLAELHDRAGHPLPLRVMGLHGSLVDASMKTARSLELPLHGGLWRIVDDRRQAVLAVGGMDFVTIDFVGSRDDLARERLRAESHVLCAEELVPSLDDTGGIDERHYE